MLSSATAEAETGFKHESFAGVWQVAVEAHPGVGSLRRLATRAENMAFDASG